ncbi:protein Tube [Musca vetustissima]|uniref:protein Tube n=1 Tax=Musca vetustissima TaxID=27455 RepID=UPI002AB67AE3|nr:protein Tube [Musca vetustissima]
MSATYTRDTELRNVQSKDLYQLTVILDDNDYWQKLMETIPKHINNELFGPSSSIFNDVYSSAPLATMERKYTNDHIRLIEKANKRTGRLCAQLLFDEWGTSGRKNERPTLGVLLYYLLKAHLFRGADYVAENLLKEQIPKRPEEGPAAEISCDLPSAIIANVRDIAEDSQYYPGTELLQQNANFEGSSMDNNKDFYTKYRGPNDKYFAPLFASISDNGEAPTPPPRLLRSARLMKQQQLQQLTQPQLAENVQTIATLTNQHEMNTVNEHSHETANGDASSTTADNLPNLPLLMKSSSSLKNDSTPNLSFLIGGNSSISSAENKCSNNDIPASDNSSFSNDIGNVTQMSHDLPAISALNLNGERDNASKEINNMEEDVPSVALNFCASSTSTNSTSIGILSCEVPCVVEAIGHEMNMIHSVIDNETDNSDDEDDVDDDDDADVPNLSIFNDSSLTSVTNTSAENSFEQNNDSRPTSTDNIPPLNTECIPTLN